MKHTLILLALLAVTDASQAQPGTAQPRAARSTAVEAQRAVAALPLGTRTVDRPDLRRQREKSPYPWLAASGPAPARKD